MERHKEMRSPGRRERRREKRRDKGVTAVRSHSVTPRLAVFTELSVTWGRPLPGDLGHQGDEKIIAPSVGASRDGALMDTTGN